MDFLFMILIGSTVKMYFTKHLLVKICSLIHVESFFIKIFLITFVYFVCVCVRAHVTWGM